jgi:cyclophilin family peptidyl-prolyl cis-trans isomerase
MARIKPQALLLQSKKKKGPTRISITTIILCNLLVVLIVLCLFGSYRHWSRRALEQGGSGLPNLEDNDAFASSKKYESDSFSEPKKYDLPGFAVIKTPKGHIAVELFKDGSPEIVDRFLDLCQKGFFKGMAFRHVIKNYVIHGGNSQGIGIAEDWISRGKVHSELTTSPKHEAFMLGTSKNKHDGKGFELFITTAPIPDLNDKILVFGRVIKGEDVVQVRNY